MMRALLVACLATVIGSASLPIRAAPMLGQSPSAVDAPNHAREIDILREAYETLHKSDHAYKGHRHEAMKQIEKACDLLGVNIRGNGKGHEPQPVSDEQLRDAQYKVQAVRNHIGNTEPEVAGHLDAAAKQIGIALTVK